MVQNIKMNRVLQSCDAYMCKKKNQKTLLDFDLDYYAPQDIPERIPKNVIEAKYSDFGKPINTIDLTLILDRVFNLLDQITKKKDIKTSQFNLSMKSSDTSEIKIEVDLEKENNKHKIKKKLGYFKKFKLIIKKFCWWIVVSIGGFILWIIFEIVCKHI